VTDGLGKVLDLEIVDGRWFNREDEGLKGDAVVINEELAKLLFGLESPVGKDIRRWNAELLESRFAGDLAKATTYKVVGVVADFRGDDFAPSTPFVFRRVGLGDDYVPSDLLVRLRPGTKAVFGEKLLARLQSVVQDWRFSITPLSDHRTTNFKLYLSFITIGGFVAGLLIVMVSLGMMGVLWQNVTQRINEIGLRRALGGATRYIAAQFLGELLVVTTISVVFALAIIVQFPLNDAIEFVHREIYLGGIFAAILLMYLLVTICALYPSWLASRVQPAEALHHE
jgi:putative ABC transport system permease protein